MITGWTLVAAVGTSLAAIAEGGSVSPLTACALVLDALFARMVYVAWCREQRRLDNVSRWGTPLETPR